MSRYIPESTKKQLLEETQFRCAYCLISLEHIWDESNYYNFAEKAHLEPYSQEGDNSFENLICLCPNCHTKFDKHPNGKESIARLKSLKSHWFVASGHYSKLELDCLFDLFNENKYPWFQYKQFTNTKNHYCFAVPKKQGYLFQNLIKNELVTVILEEGAFINGGIKMMSGYTLPAEDTIWIFLNDKGILFCEKFHQSDTKNI